MIIIIAIIVIIVCVIAAVVVMVVLGSNDSNIDYLQHVEDEAQLESLRDWNRKRDEKKAKRNTRQFR